MHLADQLLDRYPLISNQVDGDDLRVILTQLEQVIKAGAPGSVVEFGCYLGTTSLFIRRALNALGSDKAFHVYDSFEGLPPKRREDDSPAGTQFQSGALRVSKKQFSREFQRARLVPPVIHKGWFDQLGALDVPAPIAFAFLDGDFYQSIKSSLQLVLPRLSPGGVIVVHDYAREALPGVARAVREQGLAPRVQHGLGIMNQPLA